ncbi:hypothetical protein EYC80_002247 [Monilinia laxa]|uniref:Uncharacterized protein n=1 Tax=Monilinia laxa TaxID=61186 RepID=A0A5N6K397_MONLA|nr:hypothetical protein EYC80_002247 [Monilinia laxa]
MGAPGKFEVWIIRAKCAHSLRCVQNASTKKYYMPSFLATFEERGSEFEEEETGSSELDGSQFIVYT